jgi:hypothetical protein
MRGPVKRTSKPKVGQLNGGEGGIRTHGTVSRTLAFEASTFNRSVTSPRSFQLILSERMLPGLGYAEFRMKMRCADSGLSRQA